MFCTVLSREKAVRFCHKNHGVSVVMISITDIGLPVAKVHTNIEVKSILRLQFDDVEEGNGVITSEDARKIADFVIGWKDWVCGFIVHCEAGYSRSAGVAAAILQHFNGNTGVYFNSSDYCPNKTCYKMVLEALETKVSS